MKHIRRLCAVAISTFAMVVGFVTTANAMPLPIPPAGPDAPAGGAGTDGGGGLAIWQLALIAAASAAVLVIATMFATLAATRARRAVPSGAHAS